MNLISSWNCLVNTFVTLWLKNFFWRTTDWEVRVNHKWIHLKCFFSHLAFDFDVEHFYITQGSWAWWQVLWYDTLFGSTHLKVMMLGCLSLRRCLISVSLMSLTFFTATSSPWNLPRKTAPCAPLPTHCSSEISSNGTSHDSETHTRTRSRYIVHQLPDRPTSKVYSPSWLCLCSVE